MAGSLYHWSGNRILSPTILKRKRRLRRPGGKAAYCPTDIRRWVMPPSDDVMHELWLKIEHSHQRDFQRSHSRTADLKAKAIWHYVVEQIRYVADPSGADHWQFPQETMTLKQGDCEDKTFLAVSLMLAAGLPHQRVRFTAGAMYNLENGKRKLIGHAWPMYRTSRGIWCILETCLRHLPAPGQPESRLMTGGDHDAGLDEAVFLRADRLARDGRTMQFIPLLCMDGEAVWATEEMIPGQVQAARRLHPDWNTDPGFDELWKRESNLSWDASVAQPGELLN